MSNIIITAEDAYKAFLRGIRKYSTTTVTPVFFNSFFNDCMLEWVKEKLPLEEFNQKRIDDLSPLRIITDGGTTTGRYTELKGTSYVWDIPTEYNSLSSASMPMASVTYSGHASLYPLYLHGLNAMFRIDDDDEWEDADIMRSDKKPKSGKNPYREPSESLLYYERVGNTIMLYGSSLAYYQLRLEYIRYPKIFNYSTTTSSCVDPEFAPSQNKEIVDLAVRKYLEIIQDPRYKSFLQEEVIRSKSN